MLNLAVYYSRLSGTDPVDMFTAFRFSLCLTLALCSTIRLERQRSSANSVISSIDEMDPEFSSSSFHLSVACRSKFFIKMEENSWS